MVGFETASFRISQLAGVAHGAIGLVAGYRTEFLKGSHIRARRTLRIYNLPEVQPPLMKDIVLDRKYMSLPINWNSIKLLLF